MKYPVALLLFCMTILSYSCKDDPPGGYTADIRFISPASGAVYNSEDQVNVRLDFENDATIELVAVFVINSTSVDTVYSFSDDVNAESGLYAFQKMITVSTTAPSDWKVRAITWERNADPSGGVVAERAFVVTP
jgi:hypothetical protein